MTNKYLCLINRIDLNECGFFIPILKLKTMTLTIDTTAKNTVTNSPKSVKILCTNCIYGDYWSERHMFAQREVSGFDCSYPTIGSKLIQNIDSELISDDEDIAARCPKYRPSDTAN
jgi:hypothetical protein